MIFPVTGSFQHGGWQSSACTDEEAKPIPRARTAAARAMMRFMRKLLEWRGSLLFLLYPGKPGCC
jgi:hypothetical protein